MSVETIVVEKPGKFGPLVNGEYYSFSKFFKGNKDMAAGESFTVDVYTAASGKKYINSIVGGEAPTAPKIVAPVFKETPVAKASPKAAKSELMSKDEWAAKDQRISRQGVIQVAVQVTSSFEDAVVLADKMLGYVNGAK